MLSKEEMKERLNNLIHRYKITIRMDWFAGKLTGTQIISEETIRSWLNELLLIFGWDVQNTNGFGRNTASHNNTFAHFCIVLLA